ncbi:hypothetical protein HQO83_03580 [Rhodococcus fascians]|nr:hypothetical protein [Rhodococcus fascians]
MGPVCGVAVESDALRIAYTDGDRCVVESIDLALTDVAPTGLDRTMDDLFDRLEQRGPFANVVFTGRTVETMKYAERTTSAGLPSSVETVEEHLALLSFVRSLDIPSDATDVLVLDLGRHGTSAFVMNTAEGTVGWHDRTESFGGDRLDDVVEDLVMTKGILPDPEGPEGVASYRTFFRELRELLTTSAGVRAPNNGPMILDRSEFEKVVTPLIDDMLGWTGCETPDAVVLLGGVAKSPLVQRRVRARWQVPMTLHDSQSPVAEGAVIRAETQQEEVPDESRVPAEFEYEPPAQRDGDSESEAAVEPDHRDAEQPVRDVGRSGFAAIPLAYLSTLADREWTRQAVLKVSAVAVSVGVVVVALMFAVFADFDNAPRSVINTDPGFEATLAEIAPPATDIPQADQPAAEGPATLSYEQLYVQQYTYSGEMYQPAGDASDLAADQAGR